MESDPFEHATFSALLLAGASAVGDRAGTRTHGGADMRRKPPRDRETKQRPARPSCRSNPENRPRGIPGHGAYYMMISNLSDCDGIEWEKGTRPN